MGNSVMNKTMLTKAPSQRTGLSQADVKAVLEAQGVEIRQALLDGQNVILPELGTLAFTAPKNAMAPTHKVASPLSFRPRRKSCSRPVRQLDSTLNPKS